MLIIKASGECALQATKPTQHRRASPLFRRLDPVKTMLPPRLLNPPLSLTNSLCRPSFPT